jgi:hypothetical protein
MFFYFPCLIPWLYWIYFVLLCTSMIERLERKCASIMMCVIENKQVRVGRMTSGTIHDTHLSCEGWRVRERKKNTKEKLSERRKKRWSVLVSRFLSHTQPPPSLSPNSGGGSPRPHLLPLVRSSILLHHWEKSQSIFSLVCMEILLYNMVICEVELITP